MVSMISMNEWLNRVIIRIVISRYGIVYIMLMMCIIMELIWLFVKFVVVFYVMLNRFDMSVLSRLILIEMWLLISVCMSRLWLSLLVLN